MKIRTKICPLMEFRLLLLVFTEERAQKPRIQNKTCVQVLAVIYWTLSCMNIESHLCMFVRVRVIVPETPPTLTAVVTPSSVVLCPFCQDKQMKKSVSVDVKCIYHMCLDGSKGGRSEARRYLQDCVGGSSPLYPALCSFTSKPNNLRPTHNCISSVGKSH